MTYDMVYDMHIRYCTLQTYDIACIYKHTISYTLWINCVVQYHMLHIRHRMLTYDIQKTTISKTWSDWFSKGSLKELKFGGSHAFARLLTATLGISNSSYVEFNQISIWQFQRSEALKPICFGPIVDSWIFSRERHLFLQKDSMNSRKEHSLHLLYTGHLMISTSKAWRYNQIVLN